MRIVVFFVILCSYLSGAVIKDMLQREVVIKENQKIVAIGPGALRLITYMNLQDRVVGVENIELSFDTKSTYRVALDKNTMANLPVIGEGGAGKMPNLEALIGTDADIIFASFVSFEQIEMIQSKTKIPVVSLSYGAGYGSTTNQDKLDDVKKSLLLIGEIMGNTQRAKELIEYMGGLEQEIKTLIKNDKKVYIGGIGYKGARGITSTENNYPSFELLGLKNAIVSPISGHIDISFEELISINPDFVFLDMLGKKIIDEEIVSKKPLINLLDAYKNNKILWLYPYNFYNTNIENIYINSYIIASHFGADINIEAKQQEIFTKFFGINADKLKGLKTAKFVK
ncbi:MAG: ABC transporter substrate-binding protein [Arcobacteraceae bacterium]